MEEKTCNRCGETKPIDKFYWSRHSLEDKKYYSRCCKKCQHKLYNLSPSRRISINKYIRSYIRKPENKAKILFQRFKTSDKKRGLVFDLDVQHINGLLNKGCKYCEEKDILKLTLDRIDNKFGHSKNNVVCACIRCNFIRRDMPIEAFEYLAPYIKIVRENGLFGEWSGCSNNL